MVRIDDLDLKDPFQIPFYSEYEDDLLVLDIRPLDLYKKFNGLFKGFFDLKDYRPHHFEVGILLETDEGNLIMGIIDFFDYKKIKVMPSIGNRYRFKGRIERVIPKLKGNDLVYLGCSIERISL